MIDETVTYEECGVLAIIHFQEKYDAEMIGLIEANVATLLYIYDEVGGIAFDLSKVGESEYTPQFIQSIITRKEQIEECDKTFHLLGVREDKVELMTQKGLGDVLCLPE